MNSKAKQATVIGAQMNLQGEMDIQGPATIAGHTNGVIRSSADIVIEQGGLVEGELYCQSVKVCGQFKGKLFCNKLIIVSSGVVDGEVSSHQMEIYDGGQFIGKRTKGPDADTLPDFTVNSEANDTADDETTVQAKQTVKAAKSSKPAPKIESAAESSDSLGARFEAQTAGASIDAASVSSSTAKSPTNAADELATESSSSNKLPTKYLVAVIAMLAVVVYIIGGPMLQSTSSTNSTSASPLTSPSTITSQTAKPLPVAKPAVESQAKPEVESEPTSNANDAVSDENTSAASDDLEAAEPTVSAVQKASEPKLFAAPDANAQTEKKRAPISVTQASQTASAVVKSADSVQNELADGIENKAEQATEALEKVAEPKLFNEEKDSSDNPQPAVQDDTAGQ
ncbi:hypothetical protein EXU30_14240 [Shewanella maritima]|uniref:Polymer-forming cytoskeletal protein n=1 Tax=Shewanella maritima TaxID=2520507 RepID=A0A411PJW9_9GAMM|nr:polymer-forming cytoskeletal protein [Shewanella maritima]QBF83722.1 hypothetical protein EXU30_14240 [Shewanella maritima]